MRHKLIPFIAVWSVVLISMMTACDNQSSTFISTADMEDILYDYHLADAMARQADGGYAKNALAYRAAVLKKYGVTQEKFDTSMVYYMRHTDQLHTMYEHIAERMQDEARAIGADINGGSVTAMGDSANVWKGETSMVLIPNQPFNLYSFDLKPDTTFHKGDRILLSFNTNFIFQDGTRDGVAALTLVLGNDSVVSRVSHMSSSLSMKLQIEDNDSLGVKSIKGFFMLGRNNDMNSSSTTLQLLSISNIQLLRVHSKAAPGSRPFGQPSAVNPSTPVVSQPSTSPSSVSPSTSHPVVAPPTQLHGKPAVLKERTVVRRTLRDSLK